MLVVSVMIGYNYFFGNAEEKTQSEKIIGQVKDLGVSLGSLLESEHAKIKDGKYDAVFDRLSSVYKSARTQVSKLDKNIVDQIDNLDKRREDLQSEQKELDSGQNKDLTPEEIDARREELQRELEELLKDSEELMKSLN